MDQLRWFAIGEFYNALACLRGCVESAFAAQSGVQVMATGVDHASQLTTHTGKDGCFA